MRTLDRWRYKLFGADPDSVAAYHSVLPHNIHVQVRRDGSYFIAKIDKVDKNKIDKGLLITEAKDFDSLVDNVNDLLYTYVNMPTNIRPYYGNVFRPEGYEPSSLKNRKSEIKELILVKA